MRWRSNPRFVPLYYFAFLHLFGCGSATLGFVPIRSEAQTGVITGRVVSEDGSGLPSMTVSLLPVAADHRAKREGSRSRTLTDVDGNFKFTGLAPRVYS